MGKYLVVATVILLALSGPAFALKIIGNGDEAVFLSDAMAPGMAQLNEQSYRVVPDEPIPHHKPQCEVAKIKDVPKSGRIIAQGYDSEEKAKADIPNLDECRRD
jgi:hypothetical protein